MKKVYLLATLILCMSMVGFGKDRYIPFSKKARKSTRKEQKIVPKRDLTDQNGREVTFYQFPGALATDKIVEGETYSYLHIDGFGQTGKVGAPALPMRNDMYVMDKNQMPTVELVDSEFIEIDGFLIHPALELATDTQGDAEPEFVRDENVYGKDAFYPNHQVKLVENQIMRDTRIAKVQVCPVQYNPVTNKLRVYSKIVYRVNGADHKVVTDMNPNAVQFLRNSAVNGEDIVKSNGLIRKSAGVEAKDYLIITHSMFKEAAQKLANWKASMGYKVEVISRNNWTTTTARAEIAHRYRTMNPKPKYFVLIGDIEQIPSFPFKKSDGDPYYGDLPYACMDGANDYTPDMARGRISVSTIEEANVVIDKIINYEKNPVEDAKFYERGVNCAQFQCDAKDGFATRRFCHTSEDIRNYVMKQGYKVDRIYYTDSDITPTNFNNGTYSNGEPIPAELLRKNGFNWNGGKKEIMEAINDGRFYLFHRDHGYSGGIGWAHPKFMSNDINTTNLHNGAKLPVVFSINCHTGEFSYPACFAEKFLRLENGGAVAVIGASHSSYSGPNDGLSIGMIEAMWPEPGIIPSFGSGSHAVKPNPKGFKKATTTLGDVLNLGLLRMTETYNPSGSLLIDTYRMFHLFGDPAMRMWTASPTKITGELPKQLTVGQTSIDLENISEEGAIVTLVHKGEIIAETKIQYGKCHLEFDALKDKEAIDLTVSAINCRPLYRHYIMNADQVAPKGQIFVNTNSLAVGAMFTPFVATEGVVESFEWNFGTDKIEYLEDTDKTSEKPVLNFTEKGVYNIFVTLKRKNLETKVVFEKTITVVEAMTAIPVGTITPDPNNYGMGIYSFAFGSFCNKSSSVNREPGYMDFTATWETIIAHQGEKYAVSVESGDTNPVQAIIYIDKNGDGTMAADEIVATKPNFTGTFTTEVAVDDSFTKGKLIRIRVMTEYSKNKISGPDSDIFYGQVEDYALIVKDRKQKITTLEAEGVGFKEAKLSAEMILNNDPEITEKGFYVGMDQGVFTYDKKYVVKDGEDNKFSVSITDLKEGTQYFFKSFMVIDGEIIWGNEHTFATFGAAPNKHVTDFRAQMTMSKQQPLWWEVAKSTTPVSGYLIKVGYTADEIKDPVDGVIEKSGALYVEDGAKTFSIIGGLTPDTEHFYKIYPYSNKGKDIQYYTEGTVPMTSAKTLKWGEYLPINFKYSFMPMISSMKFANVLNNERRTGGMNDFKTKTIEVCPGRSYDLTIKGSGFMQYSSIAKVWIDWDQDGYFSTTEGIRLFKGSGSYSASKIITIPADAPEGKTYIRVACASTGKDYNSFSNELVGSYEDYTLDINKSYDPLATWTGATSIDWKDKSNWKDEKLPVENAQIVVDKGTFYPVINDAVDVSSITIKPEAELTVAKNGELTVDGEIINHNKFTVDGGAITAYRMSTEQDATFTMNDGSVHVQHISQSSEEEALKGTYTLNKGLLTVHEGFLCKAEGFKASAGAEFTLAVGGNIAWNDYSWDGGFKGTLKVIDGYSSHYLTTFATKINTLTVAKLTIDAPGQKVYLIHSADKIQKTINVLEKCDMIAGKILTKKGEEVVNAMNLTNLTIGKLATLDFDVTSLALTGHIDGDGILSHPKASVQFQLMAKDAILDVESDLGGVEGVGPKKLIINKPMKAYDLRRLKNIEVNNTNITIPVLIGDMHSPAPTLSITGDCGINMMLKSSTKTADLNVSRGAVHFKSHLKITADNKEKGAVHYVFHKPDVDYSQGVIDVSIDENIANKNVVHTIKTEGIDNDKLLWSEKNSVWKIAEADCKKTLTTEVTSFALLTQREAPSVSVDNVSGIPAHIVGATEEMEFKLNDEKWIACASNQEVYLNGKNTLLVRYTATDKLLGSPATDNLDTSDAIVDEMTLSNCEIEENKEAHTLVGEFKALGNDDFVKSTSSVIASLIEGIANNDQFVIEGNKLYAKSTLNYETADRLVVKVAFDSDKMDDHEYIINVKDVDDAPVFKEVTGNNLDENHFNEIEIIVSDEDCVHGDVLTCSFKPEVADNDFFNIETIDNKFFISFKEAPNFEEKATFNPIVIFKDVQDVQIEVPVEITVNDVKELPKEITFDNYKIDDNIKVGTKLPFSIVDDDETNGKYTVTIENIDGINDKLFTISENNLVVDSPVGFYYEANPNVVVTLKVVEEGVTDSETFDIIFTIEDKNEAPRFLTDVTEQHVKENLKGQFVIQDIAAIDPERDDFTLALAKDSPSEFAMEGTYLVANKSLNFEKTASYDVDIVATDAKGLSNTKTFNVLVDDQNDIPMAIMQDIAQEVKGGSVITLDATESSDEDTKDVLTYAWKVVGVKADIKDADKVKAEVTLPVVTEDTKATVVLTVKDGKEEVTVYHHLIVKADGTGVDENISIKVDKVYPNPCTDHFIVTLGSDSNEAAHITLINNMGSIVWSKSMNAQQKRFEVNVASGIYYVKIQRASTTSVQKLIVK
ncbi:T9SS type A sorting domain-containing protein [Halosquirtibacter laminarini]|uniref:T9SS type A sorting domain-containing protein n=1 Tax=Halosquirtibacter laminarini TaxID=3374600 RepID=A0AC61NPQ7_9BACT|nr:T9SS type A sorting domain-containing protein [Prolixibacteraceae bacterium]